MTFERRLRETLERTANEVEPAVELRLERTIKRAAAREASPVGSIVAGLLIVVLVGIGLRYSGLLDGIVGNRPPDGRAVAGTYTVQLLGTDEGVAELGLAGEWSMTLGREGTIDLIPPASFTGSRAQGHTFNLEGATFRTDLYYNDYCGSIGVFTWERTATALIFSPDIDDCQIRRVLLGTRAWSVAP